MKKKRTVTGNDRKEMKEALEYERDRLTVLEGGSSLCGADSLHGFSMNLVDTVVSNLDITGSASDIISILSVYSVYHARIILELIQEFFNDIDNYDNELELLCSYDESVQEAHALASMMKLLTSSASKSPNSSDDQKNDTSDSDFDFDD